MRASHILYRQLSVTSSLRHNRLLSTHLSRVVCHNNNDAVKSTSSVHSPRMRYSTVVSSPHPELGSDVINAPITSVGHFVMNEFHKYSRQTALVDSVTGREINYGDLETMVAKVSSSLIRHGLISKGSVVTIFSANCVEYAIIYLAIVAAGAIVSAVNPVYTVHEVVHAINHIKSTLLVTTPSLLPVAQQACQKCPSIKEIVVFGDGHEGCRPFSSLLDDDMSHFPENIDIDIDNDVAALPFSSGTTGLPKAVMLTHRNLHVNVEQTRSPFTLNFQRGVDCFIAVLPFYHIYGQVMLMLAGLASGCKTVTMPKFEPTLYLECVQKYKATFLMAVPPIMLFLSQHPLASKTDFSSVTDITSGAAPLGSSTAEKILENCNNPRIQIRQVYGLTESSPLTHCHSPGKIKPNTVGTATPSTQFKVVDVETGKAKGLKENGEILTRGPQVMKGYYNNEKATKETLDEHGWLHSGDCGHFDEDGHLVIEDRLKELIKVKGFQVAPAELEALLVSHEDVQDAAVIGRDDERAGELPTAFVVLKPHRDTSEQQLQQFVAGRVAPFKRLTGGVVLCKEIPKSASGKILRRVLRDQLKEQDRAIAS